ncbi:gamma-glutamyl-gamma-aminobutyrate hydrolase family protein [Streptomyces sp. NBC_00503]|uniref:gamma-glutamyl-gamma-aminobutyrate hydrolase family protein n=1 Tax=Streptomyces sp. NBC_00503 TaxID=2903659 RepID=UPI002E8065E0|nr:gamma-glutamyl-gamma-aminobutyrate hydrolase family protein [Streptomyces sp. NBC_00503]WUD80451.1 gamma-glutamyl-gamma-aminobutyrate hydrolase family protein [Streptomyces sp. NBC_00503]
MPRPLIGITTYIEASTRYGVWDVPTALVPTGYYELVQASGGTAVLLPPDDPQAAPEVLNRLDGLVVAGGPDVDPVRYGAARDPRTGPAATQRDDWELALITAALSAHMPLLGICRGMQALNVALGGTLIQHIDGHVAGAGIVSWHPVRPVPGTRYAALVPEESEVPTYHHQAVDRLGTGLVASSHAVDGTIESIELTDPSHWALGVQWHPERDKDTRVMSALIAAASTWALSESSPARGPLPAVAGGV